MQIALVDTEAAGFVSGQWIERSGLEPLMGDSLDARDKAEQHRQAYALQRHDHARAHRLHAGKRGDHVSDAEP